MPAAVLLVVVVDQRVVRRIPSVGAVVEEGDEDEAQLHVGCLNRRRRQLREQQREQQREQFEQIRLLQLRTADLLLFP